MNGATRLHVRILALALACGCASQTRPTTLELGGAAAALAPELPLDAEGRVDHDAEIVFETPEDWLCTDTATCSSCANLGEHPTRLRIHVPDREGHDRHVDVPPRAVLEVCGR